MDAKPLTEQTATSGKRHVWLRFLLIITFAGIVVDLIIMAASAAGAGLYEFILTVPIADTLLIEDSICGWIYLLVKFILLAALFTGTLYMWLLKRRGFWIYAISQLALLLIPFVFLSGFGTNYLLVRLLVNTIFTLLFILLYAMQLKNMH
jgi:hypothetical protein